jgi:acetyl esterase/lipase
MIDRLSCLFLAAGIGLYFALSPAGLATVQEPVHADLVYASAGDRVLTLDLYLPQDAPAPVPLIVWVHGGAWRTGSKANPRPALSLLERGYAVATIGYRLSQEATFPAQIQEVKAAVRWLRAHAGPYGLDSDRFGAFGPSAGGHLVALLGTAGHVEEWEIGDHLNWSSRVQAVVSWFGPSDFLRMNDMPGAMDHDAPDSPESQLVGAPIREHPHLARRASPITYITPGAPPFLLMHGDRDALVIPNQSELLHEALVRAGVASTLHILPGLGHGGAGWDEHLPLVHAFLDLHLKTGTP